MDALSPLPELPEFEEEFEQEFEQEPEPQGPFEEPPLTEAEVREQLIEDVVTIERDDSFFDVGYALNALLKSTASIHTYEEFGVEKAAKDLARKKEKSHLFQYTIEMLLEKIAGMREEEAKRQMVMGETPKRSKYCNPITPEERYQRAERLRQRSIDLFADN